MSKFNMRVELDPAPVRHIAVECPKCKCWFHGYDIVKDSEKLIYNYDLHFAEFVCPLCDTEFGYSTEYNNEEIEESAYPEIYENCFEKEVKTTWEIKR